MDTPSSSQQVLCFSHKTTVDHARGLIHHWKSWSLVGLAVFGALWTVSEASIHFLDLGLRGWLLYTVLIAIALVCASIWVLHQYINAVPDGLESESKAAQRIAQVQRPMWEFDLARQLLGEKLSQLDKECDDLLAGRTYVGGERPPDINGYMRWLGARPDNLMRMLEVAKGLLVGDLPAAIQSTPERTASAGDIVGVTNRIRSFYAETVAFEREAHGVIPPKNFEQAHKLQLGWAAPIRNAVQQMLAFLDNMVKLDPDRNHHIKFDIVFEEPPNVEEFCAEFDRLEARLPEILGDSDEFGS